MYNKHDSDIRTLTGTLKIEKDTFSVLRWTTSPPKEPFASYEG